MDIEKALAALKAKFSIEDDIDEQDLKELLHQHPEYLDVIFEGEQSAVPEADEPHLDSTGVMNVPTSAAPSNHILKALVEATL